MSPSLLLSMTLSFSYSARAETERTETENFSISNFNPWLTYGSWGVFLAGSSMFFMPEPSEPVFSRDKVNLFDSTIYEYFKTDESVGTFGSPMSLAIFPWMATPFAMYILQDEKPEWLRKSFVAMNACLFTVGLQQVISKVAARERPDGSDFESFYSGHSANAFVVAGLIAGDILEHRQGLQKLWAFLPYTVASAMAFSRVFENKHFATDVLTGALVGAASGHLFVRYGYRSDTMSMRIKPNVSHDRLGLTLSGEF